MEFAEQIYDMT
jgi:hypothetical protein